MISPEINVYGLASADTLYREYGCRARELKQQGAKIIGYLCAYVPQEIIAAAGFIPFRIIANLNEPITEADEHMETIVCPLVRNRFDQTLKGTYDFLDGLVIPHACDSICRTYDIWKDSLGLPFNHFINVPHGIDDSSLQFFTEVLNTFRISLGEFAGKEISDDVLNEAIRAYNLNRTKVNELYTLRKSVPSPIYGSEVVKTLVAGMGIPIQESTSLLEDVINEVKQRQAVLPLKTARLMIVGAELTDVALLELIEDVGANVVADELCPGARENLQLVEIHGDPIAGIAERYLRKINCPRTYLDESGSYDEYLEMKFGYLRRSIKDFHVDGVVIHVYRYCDPFGFDVPAMKSYLKKLNIPVLHLEDEYSLLTSARIRTKIQAFLEMLDTK